MNTTGQSDNKSAATDADERRAARAQAAGKRKEARQVLRKEQAIFRERQAAAPPPSPPAAARPVRRPGAASAMSILLSGLVFVGLPVVAAAIYFFGTASNQYASRASFVIKSSGGALQSHAQGALSGLAGMAGLGGGQGGGAAALADMMVVNDYISSPQILADIEPKLDVRALYANPQADWLARLRPPSEGDPISKELLLAYWKKMVRVHFDINTGISTLEVRAFSADDAQKVAQAVLGLSEDLVNRLSERAQADTLEFARGEVAAARTKAVEVLDATLAFQERAQQVNPDAYAKTRSEVEAMLEQSKTQLESQLELLRQKLPEEAPTIARAKTRLAVTTQQLATERERSTLTDGASAAEVANEFAKLKLETQFATQAYMSALASLEAARMEAVKQGLYLEAFSQPQKPETAEFPRRTADVLLVLAGSLLVWGIGGLLVATAREHI
jgi:capsular polysaccharide transport system permease protein